MKELFFNFLPYANHTLRVVLFSLCLALIFIYLIGFFVAIYLYITAYKHAFTEDDKNNWYFKVFTFIVIWLQSPKHIVNLLMIALRTLL